MHNGVGCTIFEQGACRLAHLDNFSKRKQLFPNNLMLFRGTKSHVEVIE